MKSGLKRRLGRRIVPAAAAGLLVVSLTVMLATVGARTVRSQPAAPAAWQGQRPPVVLAAYAPAPRMQAAPMAPAPDLRAVPPVPASRVRRHDANATCMIAYFTHSWLPDHDLDPLRHARAWMIARGPWGLRLVHAYYRTSAVLIRWLNG